MAHHLPRIETGIEVRAYGRYYDETILIINRSKKLRTYLTECYTAAQKRLEDGSDIIQDQCIIDVVEKIINPCL